MNDLLIKLREQLVSMIEEIDNYNISLDETIIIRKEDFKNIKFLGKIKHIDRHVFEYKNGVQFELWVNNSVRPHEYNTYTKLMNGTLKVIILNKKKNVEESDGYLINYELEDIKKTTLRNLYNPIKEDDNEQTEMDNN